MKKKMFLSGCIVLLASLFMTLFSSCSKEGIEQEVKDANQELGAPKLLLSNFIGTSPTLNNYPFLFYPISSCNAPVTINTGTTGWIYAKANGVGVRNANNSQSMAFTQDQWVWISPPYVPGTQPPTRKWLMFRYFNGYPGSGMSGPVFNYSNSTGLWTIPTSNGTWEAIQVNPPTPC